jgi:anti-anti-sigma factor
MSASNSPQALHLVRMPGESGPILRCSGELSVATAEALRRELALLLPMGHPVLTLNIAGCRFVDVDGVLAILQTYTRLRRKGTRLVIVAGAGHTARLLHFMGIDRAIPIFPIEEMAARAVRTQSLPEPAPATWEAARAQTVAWWCLVLELLDQAPQEEVLRQITAMTPLCERSEELLHELPAPATPQCHVCPLFYAIGGEPEDVGCRSVLDPILHAVRAGDRDLARIRLTEIIRTIEEMPLPEDLEGMDPVLAGACDELAVA